MISSIVDSFQDTTLIEVKEKLIKEFGIGGKDGNQERELKVTNRSRFESSKYLKAAKGHVPRGYGLTKSEGFKGKCFICK